MKPQQVMWLVVVLSGLGLATGACGSPKSSVPSSPGSPETASPATQMRVLDNATQGELVNGSGIYWDGGDIMALQFLRGDLTFESAAQTAEALCKSVSLQGTEDSGFMVIDSRVFWDGTSCIIEGTLSGSDIALVEGDGPHTLPANKFFNYEGTQSAFTVESFGDGDYSCRVTGPAWPTPLEVECYEESVATGQFSSVVFPELFTKVNLKFVFE